MGVLVNISNTTVAAVLLAVWFSLPAVAQEPEPPEPLGPPAEAQDDVATALPGPPAPSTDDELDRLFEQLRAGDDATWPRVEADIWRHWSRSGSPAMDLLLKRGRDAMDAGDFRSAIDHLTALTDHAPDFAEGYNARATAFFRAGQYGLAADDIRSALALNPRHFGALTGLGVILEEVGQKERALAAWRAAEAIHPRSPGILQAIERLERQVSGTDL
jgi:Flp pilus assembly protein TadD